MTRHNTPPSHRFFHHARGAVQLQAALFLAGDTPEVHLCGHVGAGSSFADQARQLLEETVLLFNTLTDNSGSALFVRLFVSDATNQQPQLEEMAQELHTRFGHCAVSIIEQPPLSGGKLSIWLYGTCGNVQKKPFGTNGVELTRPGYRHLWSAGLTGEETERQSDIQTESIFRQWCDQLKSADCTLARNCLRTWLYVRDIDVNYGGVVVARRELFTQKGLTEKSHYLSSTGIEGRHSNSGIKVVMDACAVAGITPQQVKYLHALDHLNPTHEYGVTFERGTAVDFGDRRHIYISGTASIDKTGQIVHPMEPEKQVIRAVENISALLADAEAELSDAVQMLVYLRDPADLPQIESWLNGHCPETPKVFLRAPVCRPGWLVEIECIAVKAVNHPEFTPF